MSYHTIPIGEDSPKIVNMIVEIPQGSSNKYEYDHELDVFKLDRTLYSPLFYPFDYGWICDTLADDGDPLDILVMTTQPTFPGCLIAARPLGVLMMRDDKGADEKILSVAAADPRFSDIAKLSDLPSHILKEIVHFFDIYKELEEKQTIVLGWQDVDTAHSVIEKFRLTPAGEPMRPPVHA
ncbi:MAG: inorganic diphosphatase [Capsulimonas sp.]|uniref:inorganic diphosphatase n=1 Tax=Capsulimonas sp. TaxID=2494211 RepID=UPI00326676EF|nr:ppa [Capsulimonas sp.]